MPKGHVTRKTLEKLEMQRQFRERMSEAFTPLMEALVLAAVGVTHMMAKGRDGKWTEVTDPAVMARVLESGESFYQISARNPDTRALKDIFDRMLGAPKQTMEVELTAPGQMSDDELRARALALCQTP